jgi:UDP-hydrolysing UDP-N-acetyl-D-glucosamine 2-epimerase
MPRILSVSSGRADVDILLPVWRGLVGRPGCELHVMLTGAHVAGGKAADLLPQGAILHRGGADLGGTDAKHASDAIADILRDTGRTIATVAPDVVLVMGDRLDMLPAAAASLPFNVPLAHIHGGEVTEGAIDDRVRHALSKLAHIHFVSSAGARDRLLAMGEVEERIHVTGAPGLDTALAAPVMTRSDFLAAVGLPEAASGFRLVTVHPETNSQQSDAPLEALLSALYQRPGVTLFTAPNSDPGGAAMRTAIEAFVARHSGTRFVETLGPKLYPNALRHADVMVGNSSSGLIEAGLFGLPVIDIGERQRGREHGENVVRVANDGQAILAALDQIKPNKRFAAGSPYGDGKAGPRIVELLATLPARDRLLRKPLRLDLHRSLCEH